jgi:predicted Zn-dependent protease
METLTAERSQALTVAVNQESPSRLPVRDVDAQSRLNRVGSKLVQVIPDLTCTCRFSFLSASGRNAASFRDGRVYITPALYAQMSTDDLLAAVLAHELAHVATPELRLRPRRRSGLDCEIAADSKGMHYLSAAGYDPQAMRTIIRMVEHEQPPGWARARLASLGEP